MTRKLIVEVDGDTKGLGGKLDDATTRTQKFGGVMKGVGMGIGFGVFGLVTEGIGMMVGKLGEANTAYQEDQASQTKMTQALQNSVPAWEDSITAINSRIDANMRLGFADDDTRTAIALSAGQFKDSTAIMNVNTAAMDLARLKNISLEQATQAIINADQGKMRGLAAVGIELKKGATLTEILTAVTATAGGQAEAYANGPLGKQEAAQLKVGEAMEKLGGAVNQVTQVVMPIAADIFTGIIDIFGEVWSAIQPIVKILMDELGPVFKEVAAIVSGTIIPILKTLFTAVLPPLKIWITLLATVTKTAFGVIVTVIRGAVAVIGPIIGGLVKVFGTIATAFTGAVTTVRDVATNLIKFFGGLPGRIGAAVKGMWDGIWQAFRSVLNMIIRGWNSISFTLPKVDLGPLGTFGGFTLGTPNLPYFHEGGIVQGTGDQPIMAKGGEGVFTEDQMKAMGGITIIFNGNVYGDEDELADTLVKRLRSLGAF